MHRGVDKMAGIRPASIPGARSDSERTQISGWHVLHQTGTFTLALLFFLTDQVMQRQEALVQQQNGKALPGPHRWAGLIGRSSGTSLF
jgi:hypothetical protein